MPKFMIEASYASEGAEGLRKAGGSSRVKAVESAVGGLGGKVESFHFAFGDEDAYVIVDLPDNEAAAAIALIVNATGAVAVKTVVLLSPEQVDEAAKRSVDYRPPGS